MYKIYDPLLVSNNFLELGFKENNRITPMKLQKLLYFLYRDYLQKTGRAMFSERFEAWQYGPVLSGVYSYFKDYGSGCIKEYYINEAGRILKINEETDIYFKQVINSVWKAYKSYDGIELSKMTHEVGTAWYKAWTKDHYFLSDDNIRSEKRGLDYG